MDDRIERVFFPTRGVVSFRATYENGHEVELVAGGSNVAAGLNEVLGFPGGVRCVCLTDCQGWYAPVSRVSALMKRSPAQERAVKAFWHIILKHAFRTSYCNSIHTTEQRLARWLLYVLRFLDGPALQITQDELGLILGVRRTQINSALSKLRASGVLEIARGKVSVLDRQRLESYACNCYRFLSRLG